MYTLTLVGRAWTFYRNTNIVRLSKPVKYKSSNVKELKKLSRDLLCQFSQVQLFKTRTNPLC